MLLKVSPRLTRRVVNSGSFSNSSLVGSRYSVKTTVKVARIGLPSGRNRLKACVSWVRTPVNGKSEPWGGSLPQEITHTGGRGLGDRSRTIRVSFSTLLV